MKRRRGIEDMKKVENKDMVNEGEEMGDKEDVGVEVMESSRKERVK